jgi:hypothetical protein
MRLDAVPNDPAYDVIGEGYNLHRRTDPIIFSQILKSLAMCETVLSLGAGNHYTHDGVLSLDACFQQSVLFGNPNPNRRDAWCLWGAGCRRHICGLGV